MLHKKLYIGNNCCGGDFYQKLGLEYNNPFIWMVIPYDSIKILMTDFDKLNFENIDMKKSDIRKNTFIIVIDGKVEVHFVHHEFRADCKEPTMRVDRFGHHLGCNHIWEIVWNNFIKRTKRMLESDMQPNFIIHDQVYGHNKNTIKDLIKTPCKYKRVFVTTEKIDFDYDKNLTMIIHVKTRRQPATMIMQNFTQIRDFFNS